MSRPMTNNASLSVTTQISQKDHPAKLSQYSGLEHTIAAVKFPSIVKPFNLKVQDGIDGTVPAFLHLPENYQNQQSTAAILLSGAGGGVVGPSSIYLSMAHKLASLQQGLPVLRMDYRFPARNKYCVPDVLAAMNYLQTEHNISRFVLVGWSFGGAPVFTVGGQDSRVVGCATVASQTAETEGIRAVGRRGVPVLLLHGTGDRTLSHQCSERLYNMYGSKGDRKVHYFEGDDHALTMNSANAERLMCEFIASIAGVRMGNAEKEIVGKTLVDDSDKIEKMRSGGDLRGLESVE
ncbi:alpha/beta-hydrolase [Aureobasidium pullulans]|uniref:Alpha/beta-hydrolase n=1 Tax=Aureobasidium pullulans TaxID=5580 RepID=A0A4S8Z7T1_AURPU|nr:alpha/beta-hydrolase [Aureobasidium pullulans]